MLLNLLSKIPVLLEWYKPWTWSWGFDLVIV